MTGQFTRWTEGSLTLSRININRGGGQRIQAVIQTVIARICVEREQHGVDDGEAECDNAVRGRAGRRSGTVSQ